MQKLGNPLIMSFLFVLLFFEFGAKRWFWIVKNSQTHSKRKKTERKKAKKRETSRAFEHFKIFSMLHVNQSLSSTTNCIRMSNAIYTKLVNAMLASFIMLRYSHCVPAATRRQKHRRSVLTNMKYYYYYCFACVCFSSAEANP